MALAREVTASSRSLEPMGHPRSPPRPRIQSSGSDGLTGEGHSVCDNHRGGDGAVCDESSRAPRRGDAM